MTISTSGNRCFVSDATAWEVGIKHSLDKLKLPLPYVDLFPQRLVSPGFHVLPIRHPHLHRVAMLDYHHHDPFDRMLIAQAEVERLTLVSCDQHFPVYGVSLLW